MSLRQIPVQYELAEDERFGRIARRAARYPRVAYDAIGVFARRG